MNIIRERRLIDMDVTYYVCQNTSSNILTPARKGVDRLWEST